MRDLALVALATARERLRGAVYGRIARGVG